MGGENPEPRVRLSGKLHVSDHTKGRGIMELTGKIDQKSRFTLS